MGYFSNAASKGSLQKEPLHLMIFFPLTPESPFENPHLFEILHFSLLIVRYSFVKL